ncbi:hypothetical protein TNCV_2577131 [Trichonephila clavipes]|nr:hypothetical protein TNCV_2577131 [Trichonephila clavipes]
MFWGHGSTFLNVCGYKVICSSEGQGDFQLRRVGSLAFWSSLPLPVILTELGTQLFHRGLSFPSDRKGRLLHPELYPEFRLVGGGVFFSRPSVSEGITDEKTQPIFVGCRRLQQIPPERIIHFTQELTRSTLSLSPRPPVGIGQIIPLRFLNTEKK